MSPKQASSNLMLTWSSRDLTLFASRDWATLREHVSGKVLLRLRGKEQLGEFASIIELGKTATLQQPDGAVLVSHIVPTSLIINRTCHNFSSEDLTDFSRWVSHCHGTAYPAPTSDTFCIVEQLDDGAICISTGHRGAQMAFEPAEALRLARMLAGLAAEAALFTDPARFTARCRDYQRVTLNLPRNADRLELWPRLNDQAAMVTISPFGLYQCANRIFELLAD